MKKLAFMNTISRSAHRMAFKLQKHSPEILVVAGVIGAVASAVMACKATTKLGDILDDSRDKIDSIHDVIENPDKVDEEYTPEDGNKDLAIVYTQTALKVAKVYAPAVILGGLSITAILTSNNILRKRNIALAAAYTAVDKSFKEYRGRVVERFGKELDKELRYNIKATYDRMCLVNNAVYIAKYKDPDECVAMYGYAPGDNKKHKNNPWTATGKQFAVPYVFKTCFSREPVTIDDMRETFSVKSALYLDMNEKLPDVSEYEKKLEKLESDYKKGKILDTTFEPEAMALQEEIGKGHNLKFVGKVGEFCPVKPGKGGGVLVREQNGKYYAATGTTGFRWLEAEMLLKKSAEMVTVIDPDTGKEKKVSGAELITGNDGIIDRSYYDKLVNDAIESISKYGDYEWFISEDPYIPKEKPLPDFMNIPEGVDEEVELPWN